MARPPSGTYQRLNPTTKLVVALATALVAFGIRGWTGPIVILAFAVGLIAVAGLGRSIGPRDANAPAPEKDLP